MRVMNFICFSGPITLMVSFTNETRDHESRKGATHKPEACI